MAVRTAVGALRRVGYWRPAPSLANVGRRPPRTAVSVVGGSPHVQAEAGLASALPASTASTAAASTVATGSLKFELGPEHALLGRTQGPLALYEALVRDGELQPDAEQRRVLQILNAIYHGARGRQAKGLYLWGGVGCGKSMAMDLFFTSMQNLGLRVQRQHFHEFMNGVHRELHRIKCDEGRPGVKDSAPIDRLAERLAGSIDVLCFDEFAITTIQDCVLLMPLFSVLFRHGVTVVVTSNRVPEDLYTSGLNRHLYLPPFLDALRANCKIHHLPTTTDYRVVHFENSTDAGVFCWPPDRAFMDRWLGVTAGEGSAPGSLAASYGRSIEVPQLSRCGRVARFAFGDLCSSSPYLSADDYMSLCRQVHTVLLDDVPRLGVDDHNEARRFTQLIDCLYEHNVRLICTMAGPPRDVLGGLSALQDMTVTSLGQGQVGCGDGDTSPSSSGVLQAIDRIKESMVAKQVARDDGAAPAPLPLATSALEHDAASEVLRAEVARVQAHGGPDIDVWRQTAEGPAQVSKAWDDRRRISQFTWEAGDPTAEQQVIKGVFAAAVASLQESGFAVDRAISRLQEMQTSAFQDLHKLKHCLAPAWQAS